MEYDVRSIMHIPIRSLARFGPADIAEQHIETPVQNRGTPQVTGNLESESISSNEGGVFGSSTPDTSRSTSPNTIYQTQQPDTPPPTPPTEVSNNFIARNTPDHTKSSQFLAATSSDIRDQATFQHGLHERPLDTPADAALSTSTLPQDADSGTGMLNTIVSDQDPLHSSVTYGNDNFLQHSQLAKHRTEAVSIESMLAPSHPDPTALVAVIDGGASHRYADTGSTVPSSEQHLSQSNITHHNENSLHFSRLAPYHSSQTDPTRPQLAVAVDADAPSHNSSTWPTQTNDPDAALLAFQSWMLMEDIPMDQCLEWTL